VPTQLHRIPTQRRVIGRVRLPSSQPIVPGHQDKTNGVRESGSAPPELQAQLDRFRASYNDHHTHRALDRTTPSQAYAATPKALPTHTRLPDRYRLRYDRVDTDGHVSIRRAGRMHHLGIGRRHTGKRILAITYETTVTVTHLDTGEILSEHHIDPTRSYWRNQLQPPGRWPHT